MVKVTVNNITVEIEENATLLDVAKKAGIKIPTLCYLKDINEIGACRVCVVEVKGYEKLFASCNMQVVDGMEFYTDTPKVREARKVNVQLILSQHNCNCAFCIRSGSCGLQKIANELGITSIDYKQDFKYEAPRTSFDLVRNNEKCIKCMRCISVCDKVQGMGIWDVVGSGSRISVDSIKPIEETDCALCGQCIVNCPVGALHERNEVDKAFEAIANKDKITVVQIAPAVRVAWGEGVGLSREEATEKKLVNAVRRLGIDHVFDTVFSADLTIMEEATEFIQRFTDPNKSKYPMFTSCCPGWIRTIKAHYPQMIDCLSTAKSPQQMFGAITKTYYAEMLGVKPSDIYFISIMPCLAKKSEASLEEMNSTGECQDVDLVITTRELVRMLKTQQIDPKSLVEEEFDMPLGVGTGAGVIFGATGGVMEAALRTAYNMITGENPEPDCFQEVRGLDGAWREKLFHVNDLPVRIAVAHGLANTHKLMDAIISGEVEYDFVEIMACPGGCSGGGGQPIAYWDIPTSKRVDGLYKIDKAKAIRFSHENPSIQTLYKDFLGEPGGHKAHKLLHSDHNTWKMPSGKLI